MKRLPVHMLDPTGANDGDGPVYDAATGRVVWATPSGGSGSGVVETIVPGSGISVDSTDPANPVVSATGGGGGGSGWTFSTTSVSAGLTRGSTSSGTFISEWVTFFNTAIKVSGVRYDVFTADTYYLEVDGVRAGPDVVVTASTDDVLLPATSPLPLGPGGHRFRLVSTAARRIYYRSGGRAIPSGLTGTGARYVNYWDEMVSANLSAARIEFLPGTFAP